MEPSGRLFIASMQSPSKIVFSGNASCITFVIFPIVCPKLVHAVVLVRCVALKMSQS